MIILFLILSFLRTLQGAPIPTASSLNFLNTDDLLTRDGSSGDSNGSTTRTIYQLVRSCLLTIFACVWKSVHPNIPGPRDSGWTRMKRRLTTTICVLVAPELMAMWALRQYVAAKKIANDYNKIKAVENDPQEDAQSSSLFDHVKEWFSPELPAERAVRRIGQKWTTTHGFFVQMGGFLLYEGDKPMRVLKYENMKELIEEGRIDAPIYTETDLQDRSKGDIVSKGLVALQTTWFVVQCLVRLRVHLPLSELEVVTLGFAVMNAIIYGIWWKKPQGVDTAIFIPLNKKSKVGRDASSRGNKKGAGKSGRPPGMAPAIAAPQDNSQSNDDRGRERRARVRNAADTVKSHLDTGGVTEGVNESQRRTAEERSDIKDSWLRNSLEFRTPPEDTDRLWDWLIFAFFWAPFVWAVSLLRPLAKMGGDLIPGSTAPLRVSMFYADERGDGPFTRYATCGIGVLFGIIHVFGWWSESLSPTQLLLWRASTLITIVAPVVLAMTLTLAIDSDGDPRVDTVGFICFIASLITAATYLAARFTLITLAVIALHVRTPKVFEIVSWTTFIPHV